jgi:hypothetical protein
MPELLSIPAIPEGYIGIQNHDADSHVSFKNIRIKDKKV